ncbi:MAG: hypothetical protein JJV98_17960 [Desulfosarcina sp.]|nr:hypothetical protein [Desulfobacterales bacterium]
MHPARRRCVTTAHRNRQRLRHITTAIGPKPRSGRCGGPIGMEAARCSPPKGRVDVRIQAAARIVPIDFSNTATELVSRDRPFLFERFYRGEKSHSRAHGGAGIGLAIVKELVEAHGGSVEARWANDRIRIGLTLPGPTP